MTLNLKVLLYLKACDWLKRMRELLAVTDR